jgi:2-aminoadipate transaminase
MQSAHEFRFARSAARLAPPKLRDVYSRAARPGAISLALGMPAPELFPAEALAAAGAELLPARRECLQYAPPPAALKQQIAELMSGRGVSCSAEQVVLTTGAQQAIDLLARLLLEPGGEVILEETVYDGVLHAVSWLAPQLLTVPTDLDHGLDLEAFAALSGRAARPAFAYVIPSGHNPLGVSLTLDQRRRLVEIARRHRLLLLEDDAYGFLYYGDDTPPALRALEERWVVYLGSFSKVLAPALRAGWMVVPEEMAPALSALKHAADLDAATVSHWTISAYLASGQLPAHVARLREEYRRRRDAMLGALAAHFPPGVRWNRPSGGMFVWVELPPELDAGALLDRAVETGKVAYTPGEAFAAGGSGHARHCLRLNFTRCPPAQIEEGVRRLAQVVAAARSAHPSAAGV